MAYEYELIESFLDKIVQGDTKDVLKQIPDNSIDCIITSPPYWGLRGVHPFGKNPGDVWIIPTEPFPDSHFAVFPTNLVKPMIKAGCPSDGIVLDPFCGSGTTCYVARKLGRHYIGIEINPKYVEMAKRRLVKLPTRLDNFVESKEVGMEIKEENNVY